MKEKIKKILLVSIILIISASVGLYFWRQSNTGRNRQAEEAAVKFVVENFGRALKNVSLLSPAASQDIEKNYKDFLDPALLAQWKADPSKAIGRLTSSPWPDEIAIADIRQFGSGAYDVSGKIIDMTSAGMAGSRAIQIGVVKFGNRWLITGVSVISSEDSVFWKDYNEDGVSFQYPEKLTAKYVFAQQWPPTVKIESGIFSCMETPQEISSMLEITSQRIIGNRIYCVDIKNEGAAGSVYSSYVYTTPLRGKLVSIGFVLRYPNCANYDKEQSQTCTSERETVNLDETVNRIIPTVRWDSASSEDTLANQISKCLVSSYSGDKEKCDELLKQITDFDSCVMTGFFIMKSNPPQCQTIDGRTFIQETNSTWEQALLAINNCEVEKAFQKHSLIVTLTLKNGNKLIAREPKIDDIITIVETVEPKCGKIPIGTE
ncbi:MAG: hypothetical protein WC475_00165 [Candidatus Paceibacterota bacterium]